MNITARPSTTAGFTLTLVAAGAIVAPAVAPVADVPIPQSRDVQLVDVSWDQVLQTALANSTDIYDHFSPAAFADLQQFAANIPAYFEGSRNFGDDLNSAYAAATTVFAPTDPEPYIYTSVDSTPSTIGLQVLGLDVADFDLPGKDGLINILSNGIPYTIGICPLCTEEHFDILPLLVGSDEAAQIQPYLEFSGSPLSGILWGSFGTTVGPIIQLNDDITAITAALSGATPDYTTAFNELLDMPANVTNAFLNGYGEIDLSTLLTTFGISAPSGLDVDAFQLDLGGLLSPAGSLIDGIGIADHLGDCSIVCATLDVPNSLVGPIASLFMQDQAIAMAVGWDGVGQPLAALFNDLAGMFN
ncbi:hypothetical protein PT015_01290 [Candidatus Mycobacterium wuenschmannii]|uniref:PE-PGRS family protein n=1 Tax=Candidatus Mycobacterium wuenschmannii TaxID=3027808 RepID=A0ABY8VX18_9MYCO|nr:hypothetical protein [Candidatus Mycobacterium wuenschmannii]WIM88188.1 hypothetical protein PT015_01290 [Candidatus Mycobacterium wuenschmannii]